jgi:hypothetical protein
LIRTLHVYGHVHWLQMYQAWLMTPQTGAAAKGTFYVQISWTNVTITFVQSSTSNTLVSFEEVSQQLLLLQIGELMMGQSCSLS